MAHDDPAHPAEPKTPHLNTDPHRKVGWLELFYDLVYVATIVQLGNKLSENVSVEGFVTFALLFIPIWWVWMGMTVYNSRFSADDLVHRGLVFAQIVTISALAIFVYDGLGETSNDFAIAYAAARIILVLMYLRTSAFVPQARALTTRYATGFALAALVWLMSAFVDPPMRFYFWIIGLFLDFGTALSPRSIQIQRRLPPSAHHLPERLGLFTIIVFGESFIKVIGGFAGHEIELNTALIGLLGLAVVGGLWWLYNETIAERGVQWVKRGVQVYIYGHLPLHLGLIALAVGVYKLVTSHHETVPDEYRLLVCGAVAICLVAQGVIEFWTDRGNVMLDLILRLVGAVIVLGIGLFATGISEVPLIITLAVVVVVLAFVDLRDENLPAKSEDAQALEL